MLLVSGFAIGTGGTVSAHEPFRMHILPKTVLVEAGNSERHPTYERLLLAAGSRALREGLDAHAAAARPDSARLAALEAACPAEVYDYDWPVEQACQVSWCESRWQADVFNGASLGLFQLWSGWARAYGLQPADLFNVSDNVRVAYFIWRDHGRWSAWSCQPW